MPVRKVSNRGRNVIGRFPSTKMGWMIAFESLLERDLIYLLDYDATVEWFEEQPLSIEYTHEDKPLHYTPDFHLVECGHNVLVECKPDRFINTDENQRKFAVAHEWCVQRGWEFRVVTDRQIRAGFRLQNVKLLTRYARQTVDPAMRRDISAFLHDAQHPTTIKAIASAILPDSRAVVTATLLHLAFHHRVHLSLDAAPVSEETLVCLPLHADQEVKR